MDKQSLQLLLGQGISVERIAKRFGKDPSTVAYWLKKHGLESPYPEKHAAKGGIERDRLVELVGAGLSLAEIAAEVRLSKSTVTHWLQKHGLRTLAARDRRPYETARAAKDAGLVAVTMTCRHHGETEFIIEGRGYYRCKRCRAEGVVRRRHKLKSILVQEAGGRCVICGYDRQVRALHFHHLEPEHKRLGLSGQGVTYSLETLRAEAQSASCSVPIATPRSRTALRRFPLQFGSGPLGPIHRNPQRYYTIIRGSSIGGANGC